MNVHPAAEMFPMMDDSAFEALAADIKAHGQREPIIVHEGAILDGRNRHKACLHVGVQPEFMDWSGSGDPIAFVVSMNLHRRHLNESQRAMIASKLANIRRGEIGRGRPIDTEISVSKAAALLHVNKSTVSSARTVHERGTADEVAAVERGDAAVSTTARVIREREQRAERSVPKAPPPNAGKARVFAPDGVSLSDHIRVGIALESGGKTAEAAAAEIKVGLGNYRLLRDIVSLSENQDLSETHRALVSATLKNLDETRQMAAVPDEVEELRYRVWGGAGAGDRRQSRIEKFEGAVGIIAEVCTATLTVDIPYLSEARELDALAKLKECQRAISKLCENIRGVRS